MLRLASKTFGALAEWRDRIEAIKDNTWVRVNNRKEGERWVKWKTLTKQERQEVIDEMIAGDFDDVSIDGEGLIQDLAIMEAEDLMIGSLSKAERGLLNESGSGIFAGGNLTTWINRAHSRAEQHLNELRSKAIEAVEAAKEQRALETAIYDEEN